LCWKARTSATPEPCEALFVVGARRRTAAIVQAGLGHVGITDPSQAKKYTERTKTWFDHRREIRRCRPPST
jgi:hypothetical protein